MSKISIGTAKAIRESIAATHIVIFAITEDGTQHVVTHGKSRKDANEAASFGNMLKSTLKWPEGMCHDKPLPRVCANCVYWKPDYGFHCFNGWSGDGSTGFCRLEPQHTKTDKDNTCQHFESL